MVTWISIMVGIPVGIFGSFIAGLILFSLQFKFSNAGFRLKSVVAATREYFRIKKSGESTGSLRNRYRYSLGIFIDEFSQSFLPDFQENGPWPMMIEPQGDRWQRYDFYIRPVINDINSYSFLGWITFFNCKLRCLVKLCNASESVIAELDAVLETESAKKIQVDDKIRIQGDSDSGIEKLKERFHNLHSEWNKWIKICGI